MLGAVIEQGTGRGLSQVIDEQVARPLGIASTSFRQDQGRLARAYKDGADAPERIGDGDVLVLESGTARVSSGRVYDAQAYESGGAGMLGTADDYLKLLECLRLDGAPLLNSVSTAALLSNAIGKVTLKGRGAGWTFGLGPVILADPLAAGQRQGAGTWSWCGVYGSHYWVDPVSEISLVVLTNTAVAGAWGRFADALVEAVYSWTEADRVPAEHSALYTSPHGGIRSLNVGGPTTSST